MNLALPKLPLPKDRRLRFLLFFLGFLLLILLVEGGYYYFRAKSGLGPAYIPEEFRAREEETRSLVEVRAKRTPQVLENIKAALAEEEDTIAAEARLLVSESCRLVSPQDPAFGTYRLDERRDRPGEGLVDYFYEGIVVGVEEVVTGECIFDNLNLSAVREFTIAAPRGILATGALGKINASFLDNLKRERIKLRVRYQEQEGSEALRFVEWEVVNIFVD